MGMSGWIKTYRSLADHWLAKYPEKLGWWVLLLLKVAHKDEKVMVGNQVIELKRGQIIASYSYLAELWKTSRSSAERFITLLEKEKMLGRCAERKVSIITICNYESYQDKKSSKRDDVWDDAGTMLGRCWEQNKEYKEDKEIYNTSTAHTREDEVSYIARYREEGANGMWHNTALILHVPISMCQDLFERWIVEYQHNGEKHDSFTGFKKHFISWARITIQKEKPNGNNDRQNQRRGVQVVANKVEDYQGPF